MNTTRKGWAGDIRHCELCLLTETAACHSGIGWEHETPPCFYSPHPQKLMAFLSFSSSFLLCLFPETSTALTGDRRGNTPIDMNNRYKYQCTDRFAEQAQLCWAEIKRVARDALTRKTWPQGSGFWSGCWGWFILTGSSSQQNTELPTSYCERFQPRLQCCLCLLYKGHFLLEIPEI